MTQHPLHTKKSSSVRGKAVPVAAAVTTLLAGFASAAAAQTPPPPATPPAQPAVPAAPEMPAVAAPAPVDDPVARRAEVEQKRLTILQTLRDTRNFVTARKELLALVARDPENALLRSNLGQIAELAEQWNEAIFWYSRYIEANPIADSAVGPNGLLARAKAGIAHAERARAADATPQGRTERLYADKLTEGSFYVTLGHNQAAIATAASAQTLLPSRYEAYALAAAALMQGNPNPLKALPLLDKAIALAPEEKRAPLTGFRGGLKADVLAKLRQEVTEKVKAGDLSGAETRLSEGLNLMPEAVELLPLLARLQIAQGKYDDALTTIGRVPETAPAPVKTETQTLRAQAVGLHQWRNVLRSTIQPPAVVAIENRMRTLVSEVEALGFRIESDDKSLASGQDVYNRGVATNNGNIQTLGAVVSIFGRLGKDRKEGQRQEKVEEYNRLKAQRAQLLSQPREVAVATYFLRSRDKETTREAVEIACDAALDSDGATDELRREYLTYLVGAKQPEHAMKVLQTLESPTRDDKPYFVIVSYSLKQYADAASVYDTRAAQEYAISVFDRAAKQESDARERIGTGRSRQSIGPTLRSLHLAAESMVQTGRCRDAIALSQRAADKLTNVWERPRHFVRAGRLLMRLGEFSEAQKMLDEARKASDDAFKTAKELAKYRAKEQRETITDEDAARATMTRNLDTIPADAEWYRQLIKQMKDEPDEARRQIDARVKQAPEQEPDFAALKFAALARGSETDACTFARTYLDGAGKDDGIGLGALAQAVSGEKSVLKKPDTGLALLLATRAVAASPNDPYAWDTLAVISDRAGNPDGARNAAKGALDLLVKLHPDETDATKEIRKHAEKFVRN